MKKNLETWFYTQVDDDKIVTTSTESDILELFKNDSSRDVELLLPPINCIIEPELQRLHVRRPCV